MKTKYEFHQSRGKVYLNTDTNKDKIKNGGIVSLSKDKKYALVYLKEDVENLYNQFEYHTYSDYMMKRSVEDEVLDNYLQEFKLEEDIFINYKLRVRKIKEIEEVGLFKVDNHNTIIIFNHEDSKDVGSRFQFTSNSDINSDFFIVIAINELISKDGEVE